ncbi:hypothetical protein PN466_22055 [Roseofilum reptotaenium CS-1145]|uniref:Flagellar assembly protein H n=1 Tax=Roseofilum reptotaenium AO1-A TaxID=1925591 RepID=A0A1L9QSE2_9CYAN|nr:hypothetical protein [Roseofilum reptotaenium]MDB9519632.1 hypothetical protein [Roseofilum reptotaenium CS-1145]OJJ25581.1 hypothetical protein BI308_10550 [Roseofilum reptotaenium AO1-A]
MTRFIHDQFAKQYLTELLSPLGTVETNKEIASQVRYIDLLFIPASDANPERENLGLLGRLIATTALIEPFRNPINKSELRTCMIKLFTLQAQWERQNYKESDLPHLWILTPTASVDFLNSCHATSDEENWGSGLYFCPDTFKTAVIVIHQLPQTPETLWLRLLGRGQVQKQAIQELEALPRDNPQRKNVLKLVKALVALLNKRQNREQDIEPEDGELIMNLMEMYEEAMSEDREQAKAEAEQRATRHFVETLLRSRFGTLDEDLASRVEAIASLPPEEFTPLLLQLSREEVLARFPAQ